MSVLRKLMVDVDMNIVIPMAGKGSRFIEQGYREPKPLIEFNGQTMIEHVLSGLMIPGANFILIIQSAFELSFKQKLDNIKYYFPVLFTSVDRFTQGAACTVLSAHKIINDEKPLLVADSDNIFRASDIKDFLEEAENRKLDASLLTIDSIIPAFSYARLGAHGYVSETKEKEVISNHAIAGAYYFSKGANFVDAIIETIIYGDKQKGEYYMSNVINTLIKQQKTVGIFDIPIEHYHCVGTPEQLEKYLRT